MKWHEVVISLVLTILINQVVTGAANASLRCPQIVSAFMTTTLTCAFTGEIVSAILVVRPDGQTVARCNKTSTDCVVPRTVKHSDNYRLEGQQGLITLTIGKVDPRRDAGVWTCRDVKTVFVANCTMLLRNRISMVCVNGTEVHVVCMPNGTLYAPMDFIRPDGIKIARCNENASSCIIKKGYHHRYSIETVVPTLTIRTLNQDVDVGKWECKEGNIAEKTSCYIGMELCDLHCQHGGTLDNETCTCNCTAAWYGPTCELCSLDCHMPNGVRLYFECKCLCTYRWTGLNCDVCVMTCDNGDIQSDTCKCQCHNQWSGVKCDICILQCENGGIVVNDTCSCQCQGDWIGDRCELTPPERMTGIAIASVNLGVFIVLVIVAVWIFYKKRRQKMATYIEKPEEAMFLTAEDTNKPEKATTQTAYANELEKATSQGACKEKPEEAVSQIAASNKTEGALPQNAATDKIEGVLPKTAATNKIEGALPKTAVTDKIEEAPPQTAD